MKVTIVTTAFCNPEGRITYGVRVYDDLGHATYDNTMANKPEDMPKGADLYTALRDNPTNDAMDEMLSLADLTEIEVDGEPLDGKYEDDDRDDDGADDEEIPDIDPLECVKEGAHRRCMKTDGKRCYFCGDARTEAQIMEG